MQVKGGGAGAGAGAAPGGPSGARRAPCPAPGRGEEGGVVLNYIGGITQIFNVLLKRNTKK